MKIRKGDKVLVRRGKDRGKTGTVTAVLPGLNRVVIDGINVAKRARKPTRDNPKGGIIEFSMPIAAGKVGLAHPENPQRTARVGYASQNGRKMRVYKFNNQEVK